MATPYDMANMSVTGTPGTGAITLALAVSGFQSFAAAGVPNGATISYGITDGSNWEVGRGVYTASGTSLSRGPLFSSNSNAAVNLTSAATVRVVILAEDMTAVLSAGAGLSYTSGGPYTPGVPGTLAVTGVTANNFAVTAAVLSLATMRGMF